MHEIGEHIQLTDSIGRGVPVPPNAANANMELSKALLRVYTLVTGLEVVKLPDEIVDRWAAEEALGLYTLGRPTRETRAALALIVGAGRFLLNAQDEMDRAIVVELLQEALKEVLPQIPQNEF